MAQYDAGESLENLARQHDCDPAAILRWKERRDSDPNYFKPTGVESEARSTSVETDASALDRAKALLSGRGNESPSSATEAPKVAEGQSDNPSNTATQSAPAFKLPPITADALPKMIEGVDRMIMQGIAATKRLPLPRELALQVMAMPESDQKTLEFFAPYAASYLPEVEKYARPVLAGLFVAFWGMSIVGRTKALESVSKEYIAHLEKQRTTGNATPV